MSSLVKAKWDIWKNHFTLNGTWETLKRLELATIFKLSNIAIDLWNEGNNSKV